jgi:HSP20 family molecular chaperone IbpA
MSSDNPIIRVSVGSEPSEPPPSENLVGDEAGDRRPAYTPPIDIHEGPDGLTLEADLPGATQRNLRIQLEDNILSLYARIDAPAPEGARLVHEEHRVGDYQRSFILSDEVDRERITAELTNGVLRLFLPKAERVRTRRIEIKA